MLFDWPRELKIAKYNAQAKCCRRQPSESYENLRRRIKKIQRSCKINSYSFGNPPWRSSKSFLTFSGCTDNVLELCRRRKVSPSCESVHIIVWSPLKILQNLYEFEKKNFPLSNNYNESNFFRRLSRPLIFFYCYNFFFFLISGMEIK